MEMDSVNVVAAERNLQNLKNELEQYMGQKNNLKLFNDLFAEELVVMSEMIPIITAHNKRLEPKFEFEQRDDFLKVAAKMDLVNHKKKLADISPNIQKNEQVIRNAEKEIARIEAEIPRAEARVAEALKGD